MVKYMYSVLQKLSTTNTSIFHNYAVLLKSYKNYNTNEIWHERNIKIT